MTTFVALSGSTFLYSILPPVIPVRLWPGGYVSRATYPESGNLVDYRTTDREALAVAALSALNFEVIELLRVGVRLSILSRSIFHCLKQDVAVLVKRSLQPLQPGGVGGWAALVRWCGSRVAGPVRALVEQPGSVPTTGLSLSLAWLEWVGRSVLQDSGRLPDRQRLAARCHILDLMSYGPLSLASAVIVCAMCLFCDK